MRSLAWILLITAAAAFAALVLWPVGERGVARELTRFDPEITRHVPADLVPVEGGRLRLALEAGPELLATLARGPSVRALRLSMATYHRGPYRVAARLYATGAPDACRFSGDGLTLADNAPLTLAPTRLDGCGGTELVLEIDMPPDPQTTTPIALWTRRAPGDTTGFVPWLQVPGAEPAGVVGVVEWDESGPAVSRLRLLTHLWGPWGGTAAVLLLASPAVLLGLAAALARARPPAPVALAFLVLLWPATLIAVAAPPLQAPDEPDHMLSLFELHDDRDAAARLLETARRGHFERLRFASEERFLPGDRDAPATDRWGAKIEPYPLAMRSPLASAAWRWVASTEPLLPLRLLNAVLLALTGALALRLTAGGWSPVVAAMGAWISSALPFLGSHVSNYALLTAASLGLAAFVWAHLTAAPRTRTGDLAFGALLALSVLAGVNGVPLAVTALAAFAMAPAAGDRRHEALRVGWVGLGAVTAWAGVAWASPAPAVTGYYLRNLGRVAWSLLGGTGAAPHAVTWTAAALLVGAALRCAAPAADPRSTSEERSRLAALRALPLVLPALAWIALGHVTLPVPQADPTVSHVGFALRATAVFFAEIGADPPDLHLGTSLLGAYGWLDRHLPEAVVRAQQALAWAGVALVAYLAARNQRRPLRVVVAGMAPFAVIAVTVFVTALGAHARGATLLGRYLLPAHAFMVVGGGLALARLAAAADGPPRRGLVLSAVALLGTFQLALAAFLITRYV